MKARLERLSAKRRIPGNLSAARVRNDDHKLFVRLGGAYLSVFEFQAAYDAYENALRPDASEKTVAYPFGIWHYLQEKRSDKDYGYGA